MVTLTKTEFPYADRSFQPIPQILATINNSAFAVFLSAAGCCLAVPLSSETVDLRQSNTICEEAVVRTKRTVKNAEPDPWRDIRRKQKAHNAQQDQVPAEQIAEPEYDETISCLAQHNVNGEMVGSNSANAELIKGKLPGSGTQIVEQHSANGQSASPQSQSSEMAPSSSKELKNQDDHSLAEMLLAIELASVVIAILLFIATTLGLSQISRMVAGILNRRHICRIPAHLAAVNHSIEGHITVLGLNAARFVPIDKQQHEYLEALLARPELIFFDVVVSDIRIKVFVGKFRSGHVPIVFHDKISVHMQKDLFSYSLSEPRLGQLISESHNKKLHKELIILRNDYERRQAAASQAIATMAP